MYKIHTIETAPEGARETLRRAKEGYGFIPNILGVMAEAPALLRGYATLSKLFGETSLNAAEQAVVLLAASRENGCKYCMAAHTMGALRMGTSPEVVDALVEGLPLADARLESLRCFTSSVVDNRGYPEASATRAFLEAGYTTANILEIVLGVGLKTLSNYTNHIAGTPLDEVFRKSASPGDK